MKSTRKPRSFYGWLVTLLMLAAGLLGSQILLSSLKKFEFVLGIFSHDDRWQLIGFGVGLLVASLVVYVIHLKPYVHNRNLLAVVANIFAPCLYAALALVAWDYSQNKEAFSVASIIWAPALAIVPVIAVMTAEWVWVALLRWLGGLFTRRGWRRYAFMAMFTSLRWDPSNPECRRECGMLRFREDEFADALLLLECMLPLEKINDPEVLRALEQCYRAGSRRLDALQCLQRRVALTGDEKLFKKIVEDQIALEQLDPALEIIESGKLGDSLATLKMRQDLHRRLGHHEKAIELARTVGEKEGGTAKGAVFMLRELVKVIQDKHLNRLARVELAEFLLLDDSPEKRGEAVELLEKLQNEDSAMVNVVRLLRDHYRETDDKKGLRDSLRRLVAQGGAESGDYLQLARMLAENQHITESEHVLRRMIEALPDNWQGYLRLARVLYEQDELEQAEEFLARAGELAGDDEESDGVILHLNNDIEKKRRAMALKKMKAELAEDRGDIQKHLRLIEEMIRMENTAQAVAHCDQLLEEHPNLQPQVEKLVIEGIGNSEHTYMLRDYLGDLYFVDRRYDELLLLYREMAKDAISPEEVIEEGCRKILSREPEHIASRMELANLRRRQHDWEGVLEVLDPIIAAGNGRLDPVEQALWIEAAWRVGRMDEARTVGMDLVEELKDEPGFMLLMIDLLRDMNDPETAYAIFQKAIEVNPEDKRLKRVEEAVIRAHKSRRLEILSDREAAGALTPAEHFEKAGLHSDIGEIQEAIVHFQRAADDEQLANIAMAKMAVNLCNRGMYDMAAELLEPIELDKKMNEQHPDIKEAIYVVARNLERVKMMDAAVKYYKRIFRVDASYMDVVRRLERLS